MRKRRFHISIVLMLLAIVAIMAFQFYWLQKNYQDEKQSLHLNTNLLFREAVEQCQVDKLKLDSNAKFHFTTKKVVMGMLNAIKTRVERTSDSIKILPRVNSAMIISMNKDERESAKMPPDLSVDSNVRTIEYFNKAGEGGWIQVLKKVDSLQDSVTVKEVSERYRKLLGREKINLPFSILRTEGRRKDELFPPELEESNEVSVGFVKPVTFKMQLENTTGFILKRLSSQILVSFLLVGLTLLSFIILLRTLMQQRRLTQLKNDFISNITHELKTPLATVSVAIEALKNFNALQDPQRTQEYLDISANELQRLSLLVDKVLKLSMFEKQQIEFKEEWFDLKQLAEEVISSMRLQFEKYHAQVSVRTQGEDFNIRADRLHMTSVLFNLLDNALKYSKANPSIQVDLQANIHEIEISITDNGIGISPEHKKKIFDKFFRVPAGDTHNVKGYGLGLSYVAYVVQRHKGTINLESQPDIGSKFIIKISKSA